MRSPSFDIFSGSSEDDAIWVEAATDLPTATERMQQLAQERPGRYFVFSSSSRQILGSVDTSGGM